MSIGKHWKPITIPYHIHLFHLDFYCSSPTKSVQVTWGGKQPNKKQGLVLSWATDNIYFQGSSFYTLRAACTMDGEPFTSSPWSLFLIGLASVIPVWLHSFWHFWIFVLASSPMHFLCNNWSIVMYSLVTHSWIFTVDWVPAAKNFWWWLSPHSVERCWAIFVDKMSHILEQEPPAWALAFWPFSLPSLSSGGKIPEKAQRHIFLRILSVILLAHCKGFSFVSTSFTAIKILLLKPVFLSESENQKRTGLFPVFWMFWHI